METITIPENGYAPYGDAALDKLYNMLFCDDISIYKDSVADRYPWDTLLRRKKTTPRK